MVNFMGAKVQNSEGWNQQQGDILAYQPPHLHVLNLHQLRLKGRSYLGPHLRYQAAGDGSILAAAVRGNWGGVQRPAPEGMLRPHTSCWDLRCCRRGNARNEVISSSWPSG